MLLVCKVKFMVGLYVRTYNYCDYLKKKLHGKKYFSNHVLDK